MEAQNERVGDDVRRAHARYEKEQKRALRDFNDKLQNDPFYQYMQMLVVDKPSRTGDIVPSQLVAFRTKYLPAVKLHPDS